MTTRRSILKGAAASLAGVSAPTVILAATAGRTKDAATLPAPPDVGRKFFADGRVMPFAGNTIICHLPQQGEFAKTFAALLDIYRALPAHRFARKITALPPSSYHVTLFGGANDRDRRRPFWPAALPLDLPMAECNRIVGETLRGFRLGEDAPPYRMRVDSGPVGSKETPLTIRLVPADATEEVRLRRLRMRLSELLGIDAPGQESYAFHVTLAYLIEWLSPYEDAEFRAALATWKAMLAERTPIITLGAPEYCTLNDMFAFDRQFYLS